MAHRTKLQVALLQFRRAIENDFGLRTEAVSIMNERWTEDHPTAPQIAIILADPHFPQNKIMREDDELRVMDLLTTPGMPLVEIDRTPTRVWLAVTLRK